MRYFAFTVSVLKKKFLNEITHLNYERFFKNLYARVKCVDFCCAEMVIGKPKSLHYHGCYSVNKGFKHNKLRVMGYHLYIRPINNLSGWKMYCYKNYKLDEYLF